MSKTKILFVERRFQEFVSIERVFRQIASSLPASSFETTFQQLPFGNGLSGTIRNLLQFRPGFADIYHMTGQSHYITLTLPKDRTVLTIHDLRFVHDRTGIRGYVLKKLLLDLPVKRLRFITAISEATKDEIVRYTGCDPSKIRVIENPIREEFLVQPDRTDFNSSRPRILHIGITENKNIPRLLAALEGIACTLVIIGRIDDEIRDLATGHGIDLQNRADLSDAEIVDEYMRADIVSFCSTYEGFGMPIIEAQALGKPVVTSDLSPMNSVAGGGAVLVDPFDTTSIREGILSIIENSDLRNQIIARGSENVKRFSPERIAAEYVTLYDEVMKQFAP